MVHLQEVIVETQPDTRHQDSASNSMLEWLDAVAEWKAGLAIRPKPGASAADLVIEDRHARR